MTVRSYERDSYLKDNHTFVTAAGINDDGTPYAEFEETIFFPEEGGQNADTGRLITDSGVEIRVLGGVIGGDRIRYTLSQPVNEGDKVHCLLDWDVRYDRMQNHSGEHILTGLIHSEYGFDNVGFHLSDTGFVTLDLNGVISYEQVIRAETEANRVIYSNLPIKDSYPSREELETIDYRSKKEIEGQVRLITIGDEEHTVDICACCAPHVARTGEIGIIKVISVINWKGGIRISMLCGRRALEYINKEHELLSATARSLSTEAVNVPERVGALISQVGELKVRVAEILNQSMIYRIEASADDEMRCVFVDKYYPAVVMKEIYNILAAKYEGYCGIFAGDDADGYRYNAGSGTLDSRELATVFREKLGARGGGSSEMIQGKVDASKEMIADIVRDISVKR